MRTTEVRDNATGRVNDLSWFAELPERTQYNLTLRASEIVQAGPPPWPRFAETTKDGKVVWPEEPPVDPQPLLDEIARRQEAKAPTGWHQP